MQTLLLRKFMMSLVHEGPDFSAVWAADALHSPMRRGLKVKKLRPEAQSPVDALHSPMRRGLKGWRPFIDPTRNLDALHSPMRRGLKGGECAAGTTMLADALHSPMRRGLKDAFRQTNDVFDDVMHSIPR